MRNETDNISFHSLTHGSFAFLWQVHVDGYAINESLKAIESQTDAEPMDQKPPWLVPNGNLAKQYAPLADPTLHRRFAALNETHDAQVLSFANRFGALGGHDCLLTTPDSGETILGESLNRWQHEIREMSIILAIWDLVWTSSAGKLGEIFIWPNPERIEIRLSWHREDGKTELGKYKKTNEFINFTGAVSNLTTIQSSVSSSTVEIIADRRKHIKTDIINRWDQGDVVEPALYYVCSQVNQRIRTNVSPQILPFRRNELRLFPQTLLSAMWLMFMWEISGENNVFICPSCLEWFSTEDRRSMYCSGACKQKAYRDRKNNRSE